MPDTDATKATKVNFDGDTGDTILDHILFDNVWNEGEALLFSLEMLDVYATDPSVQSWRVNAAIETEIRATLDHVSAFTNADFTEVNATKQDANV